MTFAYADPPYPGQARKHYKCAEVDHALLVARLIKNYPCWALSTSAPALDAVKALCPQGTRTGIWVKPFASFKRGVNPAYTWEPVLFYGFRIKRDRSEPTIRDHVVCNITLKRGLSGAKPEKVCHWIFDFLGVSPDDEFHDLFYGSGAVTLAWDTWRASRRCSGT